MTLLRSGGGYLRAFSTYIAEIPIASLTKAQSQALDKHVDAILASPDDEQHTERHEEAISDIIYTLYGLTDEDIRIVEGR